MTFVQCACSNSEGHFSLASLAHNFSYPPMTSLAFPYRDPYWTSKLDIHSHRIGLFFSLLPHTYSMVVLTPFFRWLHASCSFHTGLTEQLSSHRNRMYTKRRTQVVSADVPMLSITEMMTRVARRPDLQSEPIPYSSEFPMARWVPGTR